MKASNHSKFRDEVGFEVVRCWAIYVGHHEGKAKAVKAVG
jgi:hypothetical protein